MPNSTNVKTGTTVYPATSFYWRPPCIVVEVGKKELCGKPTGYFIAQYPNGDKYLQWDTDGAEARFTS